MEIDKDKSLDEYIADINMTDIGISDLDIGAAGYYENQDNRLVKTRTD
jgi:hypothetical protein